MREGGRDNRPTSSIRVKMVQGFKYVSAREGES